MKTKILILAIASVLFSSAVYAQDFQKPAEGKAAVYFLRTSGLGAAINFKFFDNESYLGKFKGKNYVRYEFDAGKHLLWAKSENLSFVDADLKNGGIYLIQVKPKMGGLKAAVKLLPVSSDDAKVMEKIKKLMSKKKPVQFDLKKANKVTPKIPEYLQKYEELKNEADKVKVISADMDYKMS